MWCIIQWANNIIIQYYYYSFIHLFIDYSHCWFPINWFIDYSIYSVIVIVCYSLLLVFQYLLFIIDLFQYSIPVLTDWLLTNSHWLLFNYLFHYSIDWLFNYSIFIPFHWFIHCWLFHSQFVLFHSIDCYSIILMMTDHWFPIVVIHSFIPFDLFIDPFHYWFVIHCYWLLLFIPIDLFWLLLICYLFVVVVIHCYSIPFSVIPSDWFIPFSDYYCDYSNYSIQFNGQYSIQTIHY